MAESKGNIKKADAEAGQAVESVTEEVPHEADASSAAGPYEGLEVNRPPVSTNRPDVPIAASLVAGAGAPTPEPDYHGEWGPDQEPDLGAQAAADKAAEAKPAKAS